METKKFEKFGDKEKDIEQLELKLTKLYSDWEQLKILWERAGIASDPLRLDETTKNIEKFEKEIMPVLVELLNIAGVERERFYESARKIRDENAGKQIQVRGAIEVSNICRANCLYCPMRRDNLKGSKQMRMSSDQIVEQAKLAHEAGIKEVFIQSGEDPQMIPVVVDALRKIKSDHELQELKVVLNLGDHKGSDYHLLAKAGAEGYLIKHETIDEVLHKKMRPHTSIKERVNFLLRAREAGMYIGTGVIVGLPRQTDESLAKDIIFAGRLGSWKMVSCSPFTPSDETPLKGTPPGDFWKTLNMISIYRHLFPKARIPSVSNLDNEGLFTRPADLTITGQSAAINAGADGITINITPPEIRKNYKIYDTENKRHIVDFSKAERISEETGLPLDIQE